MDKLDWASETDWETVRHSEWLLHSELLEPEPSLESRFWTWAGKSRALGISPGSRPLPLPPMPLPSLPLPLPPTPPVAKLYALMVLEFVGGVAEASSHPYSPLLALALRALLSRVCALRGREGEPSPLGGREMRRWCGLAPPSPPAGSCARVESSAVGSGRVIPLQRGGQWPGESRGVGVGVAPWILVDFILTLELRGIWAQGAWKIRYLKETNAVGRVAKPPSWLHLVSPLCDVT